MAALERDRLDNYSVSDDSDLSAKFSVLVMGRTVSGRNLELNV